MIRFVVLVVDIFLKNIKNNWDLKNPITVAVGALMIVKSIFAQDIDKCFIKLNNSLNSLIFN